jgi:hypothetical protein
MVPGAVALAHSVQSPNLPDGRLLTKGGGYIDVQYDKKIKKLNYIQVYYPCRAAGAAKSKYPAYLSLDTNPRTPLHGGRASGSFTYKITAGLAPTATNAAGDTATVTWTVSGVKLSAPGLSGTVDVSVSGPRTVCPFTLTKKRLVPLLDIPGNS